MLWRHVRVGHEPARVAESRSRNFACAGADVHETRVGEHGRVRFAGVDAALRELPGVGADALAPEHLVSLVEQDDADVRPEAVPVKHNQTPNF